MLIPIISRSFSSPLMGISHTRNCLRNNPDRLHLQLPPSSCRPLIPIASSASWNCDPSKKPARSLCSRSRLIDCGRRFLTFFVYFCVKFQMNGWAFLVWLVVYAVLSYAHQSHVAFPPLLHVTGVRVDTFKPLIEPVIDLSVRLVFAATFRLR